MPQFDTFSFFSQLFWVFTGFILLYLSICFYLLPALSSVLKIRKRKLAQMTSSSDSTLVATESTFVELSKQVLTSYNSKFGTIVNDIQSKESSNASMTLVKQLKSITTKHQSQREFNLNVLSQAQRATLLHF